MDLAVEVLPGQTGLKHQQRDEVRAQHGERDPLSLSTHSRSRYQVRGRESAARAQASRAPSTQRFAFGEAADDVFFGKREGSVANRKAKSDFQWISEAPPRHMPDLHLP
jgi:hypothetical protein